MDSTLSKAPKNKLNLSEFFEPVRKFFSRLSKRFVDGSLGTKLSHFIFGAGNFYHKQYVKGAIFLLLQVAIL